MTMGEGGAVYTNNPLLNRLILSYRDWGRDCVCPSGHDNFCGHRFDGDYGELPHGYDHKYVYSHFGYNLKVTDMQAAVGVEQLKKFPSFIEKKEDTTGTDCARHWLRSRVRSFFLSLQKAADLHGSDFLLRFREGGAHTRNEVTEYVESHNVQTRLLFSGNLIKASVFRPDKRN